MPGKETEQSAEKKTIGWREWVSLPELGIDRLKAKVDTGARTSALHAFSVEPFQKPDGTDWVRFGVHPRQRSNATEIFCEAPIIDRRTVRDSGGHQEERFVISTTVVLGPESLTAEITLTARDDMLFRMLLGRTSIRNRFVVDSSRSYAIGKKKRKKKNAKTGSKA